MMRPQKLILATHNAEKILQIQAILEDLPIEIIGVKELNLPEPEETGSTFEENSLLKAKAATDATGYPAIGDDSGLSVDALNGNPGIYSARWAGPNRDYVYAMDKINDEIARSAEPSNRQAKLVCCVVLYWPDGTHQTFHNEIKGVLVWPGRGARKFAYDPYFQPEGCIYTFAELTWAEKEAISHRGKSFRQLKQYLLSLPI